MIQGYTCICYRRNVCKRTIFFFEAWILIHIHMHHPSADSWAAIIDPRIGPTVILFLAHQAHPQSSGLSAISWLSNLQKRPITRRLPASASASATQLVIRYGRFLTLAHHRHLSIICVQQTMHDSPPHLVFSISLYFYWIHSNQTPTEFLITSSSLATSNDLTDAPPGTIHWKKKQPFFFFFFFFFLLKRWMVPFFIQQSWIWKRPP